MEKVARRKEDAKNSQNLKEYLNILQDANSLLEEHGLDDQEIAEGLQAGVMMNSGMEQIEELLSRSSSQSLAPLQMYYLQLAETSLQQLVALSLNLPQDVTQEVLQIKEKLDKRIQDVAEGRSGAAMEVIKNTALCWSAGTGPRPSPPHRLNAPLSTTHLRAPENRDEPDRKSTRLNSSHRSIS